MSTQFILGDPSAILPFFNGESAYTPIPSPGSSRFQHFHISHNAPYLLPPPPRTPSKKKVCISIVFSFSWDGCNTQEKWKTKVMQILFFLAGGGGADKVRYGKCGSGVLPLGCATGRPCSNRRLEHVHHANVVVFFRWKSWSCMCFDSQNNLRLWSSPNNKAVGFMDETFGFVEETVGFWDISIVLQNFALS